ncbi:MAG: rhodopsin [Flavobacteriaceae bacterium]|jgi:bacteriorhodopsin|nr:rhodopsin [Flavobacteriaceae bacterium]|tara:strand:+ start:288 stop:1019 length:732 start_codon:yes stop_codon:yes gene_type:complete
MTNLFLPLIADVTGDVNNPVNFTFFIGCMAMMAASAFFFLSLNQFDKKWRTSVLVSGLITFIAAVHYWYMRDAAMAGSLDNVTAFRYVDWILTVPLMCVEFYLILKVAGATKSLMWKMIILSIVMLVTGYFGESGIGPFDAQIWGLISGIAYALIALEIWVGGASKLAKAAGEDTAYAHKVLCWFVLVGWAIYPIGYMAGTDGWYNVLGLDGLDMNVWYNIADAINKIGFGLVVYSLAVKKTA